MSQLFIPSSVMVHAESFDAFLVESGLAWDHPIVMLCRILQRQVLQLSHLVHEHEMTREFKQGESQSWEGQSLLIGEDDLTPWLPSDCEKAFENEGIKLGPEEGNLTDEMIKRLEAHRQKKGQA